MALEGANNDGKYVKLTKEEESLQNVTPGELNQPIDVHQRTALRCHECGQSLPPSYEPPANEDWTTGIFGCAEDLESCKIGLFCPCILFGRNVENLSEEMSYKWACISHAILIEGGATAAAIAAAIHGISPDSVLLIFEGIFFAWWVCGLYTSMPRQILQRKYHLQDSPCEPCCVHCCLHWCAICQEHREMKSHFDEVAADDTMVNPPLAQQMNAVNVQEPAVTSSAEEVGVGHQSLELQPL